jgi:hypothetical protein
MKLTELRQIIREEISKARLNESQLTFSEKEMQKLIEKTQQGVFEDNMNHPILKAFAKKVGLSTKEAYDKLDDIANNDSEAGDEELLNKTFLKCVVENLNEL